MCSSTARRCGNGSKPTACGTARRGILRNRWRDAVVITGLLVIHHPAFVYGDLDMLRYVIVFLVLALIAAFFGFGGAGDYSWPAARNFSYVFLALAGLTFVFGGGLGGRA